MYYDICVNGAIVREQIISFVYLCNGASRMQYLFVATWQCTCRPLRGSEISFVPSRTISIPSMPG